MPTNHTRRASASAAIQSTNWRQKSPTPPRPIDDNWRRLSAPSALPTTSGSPSLLRKASSAPAAFTWDWLRSREASPRRERCIKIIPGQIVFLPPRHQISKSSRALEIETHPETFGHPAVVSDVYQDFVVVKTITSLSHGSLQHKFRACRDRDLQYKAHMLIDHPDNMDGTYDNPDDSMPTLNIFQGGKMECPSYVRLDKAIQIEVCELQRYFTRESTEDMILDSRSLTAIRDHRAPQLYEGYTFSRPLSVSNQVPQADLAELAKRQAKKAAKSQSSASSGRTSPALSSSSSLADGETSLACTAAVLGTPVVI